MVPKLGYKYPRGAWKIWRSAPNFHLLKIYNYIPNENAIKIPSMLTRGVREFLFFCLGVREQKNVGNCWLKQFVSLITFKFNNSTLKEGCLSLLSTLPWHANCFHWHSMEITKESFKFVKFFKQSLERKVLPGNTKISKQIGLTSKFQSTILHHFNSFDVAT